MFGGHFFLQGEYRYDKCLWLGCWGNKVFDVVQVINHTGMIKIFE